MIDFSKRFVKSCGFDFDVTIMKDYVGAAAFDPKTKTIEIYPDDIRNEANSKNVSLEENLILVLSHELGHAMDSELSDRADVKSEYLVKILREGYKPEYENLILENIETAETLAWKLGAKFVPAELKSQYDKDNRRNIQAALEVMKSRIKYYKSLHEKAYRS